MVRRILATLALGLCCSISTMTLAADIVNASSETPLDHNDHRDRCSAGDNNANYCSQLQGCEFDWNSRQCLTVGGGFPGGGSCNRFDNNQQWCQQSPGCSWDWNWNRCVDGTIPGPGPQPSQCSWYDRNPQQCNRTLNCYFDPNWNRCIDRTITPPGGGNRCQAYDYNPNACISSGCDYDYRSNICNPRTGGGGGGRSCSNFDYSARVCESVAGCYFDYQWNRCEGNF